MQGTNAGIGSKKPTARSRVSNGADLLPGIDGRSAPARRYRDLLTELAAPHGGWGVMPESLRQLARRAALLIVNAENVEAAACRGEIIDPVKHATISNALSRLLARLDRATPQPPEATPPSLHDIAREIAAAKVNAA